jgi:ribonuclease HI
MARAASLAAYDDEPPPEPKPTWQCGARGDLTAEQVADQRLFFNVTLHAAAPASTMHAPSTRDTELEAIAWAELGLARARGVLHGHRIMGTSAFTQSWPDLCASRVHEFRTDMPDPWRLALQRGRATQPGEEYIPRGLLDIDEKPASGDTQRLALLYAPTLVRRTATPLAAVKAQHVYAAGMAAAFTLPRVLDSTRAAAARHLHLFEHIPLAHHARWLAAGQAARCINHPAVPREMTEVAYNVALSAFPYGPEKYHICKRRTCPCGSGAAETVAHTFQDCTRSRLLWQRVLHAWRDVTGERKLSETSGLVVLFGYRASTWLDESERAEFAGLEEPFAVVHKVTLYVIATERDRDAAPTKYHVRRTPRQLYQRVQGLVQRAAQTRWLTAWDKRHTDAGKAIAAFRKRWEAPGIATIHGSRVQVVLFMAATARTRWRQAHPQRMWRTQQLAPPAAVPADTVSIFTDGSAVPRKLGQPKPIAGYGVVCVHGDDPDDRGGTGHAIFEMCGPIVPDRLVHKNTTNNLAELVAFTHGLRWARHTHHGSVLMRYDSTYAANIAAGLWKPKKHQAAAARAIKLWADVRRQRPNLWLKHVKGHSNHRWNNRADRLADAGRAGRHVYDTVVD